MTMRQTAAFTMFALVLGTATAAGQNSRWADTPEPPPAPWRAQPAGIEVITTPDGFDNFDMGVDNAEPHGSSHPDIPRWIFTAWNTNRTRSTTNGLDFVFGAPGFGSGFSMRGDPVTAYDSLGTLYYENMYSATAGGSIEGCKVVRSTDGGLTWVQLGTSIAGVDKNWIAADQTSGPYANYVYTTMTADAGGNFARSTDFGVTWTTTANFPTQQLPGMMPAVGPYIDGATDIPGGSVYVVTNTAPTEASTFTFFRSTDGGVTFTQQSTINDAGYVGTLNSIGRLVINNARTRPYPFIAADNSYGPYRGRLYLVYASNSPAGNGNKPDIFLRTSTNQGASWSARVRVNDNANPEATNEWFPAIWCDKQTGRLYIKWYDMRNDPVNNARANVYATYSDDGGVTFAPNQRVSNQDFVYPSPACAANSNCYRGDYDAITSNGPVSVAIWTDFRSGNYTSTVAYFPDYAMLVSPAADSLRETDSTDLSIRVPAVKLYTGSVTFSASVVPATGIALEWPEGNVLAAVPDTLPLRVRTTGAPVGLYTITITGEGPGGTPVHRRTATVRVLTPSITLTEPNGGDVWPIGSARTVRWSSTLLTGPVRVELSRDGGISYAETLFAATTNDGIEAWTVTSPATAQARVRISGVVDSGAVDASIIDFSIVQPVITVSRPLGGELWEVGKTDSIRWISGFMTGNVRILLSRNNGVTFPETLFSNTANDGLQLWTPTGPATDSARFRVVSIVYPGVSDTTPAAFSIYTPDFTVQTGWNMVSLPRRPADPRAAVLFPSAVSPFFTFGPAGYAARDSLEFGAGYWARFSVPQSITIAGTNVSRDTLSVPAGWSLIGSLTYPVPLDSITTAPDSILQGVYGYIPGTGYVVSPPVLPAGSGFWVKTTQSGELILRRTETP